MITRNARASRHFPVGIIKGLFMGGGAGRLPGRDVFHPGFT